MASRDGRGWCNSPHRGWCWFMYMVCQARLVHVSGRLPTPPQKLETAVIHIKQHLWRIRSQEMSTTTPLQRKVGAERSAADRNHSLIPCDLVFFRTIVWSQVSGVDYHLKVNAVSHNKCQQHSSTNCRGHWSRAQLQTTRWAYVLFVLLPCLQRVALHGVGGC